MASFLKTVGSGLNVQERKRLETTGVMAKHWINTETGFQIFFFSVIFCCWFFSYKMGIFFNLKIIFCKLIKIF